MSEPDSIRPTCTSDIHPIHDADATNDCLHTRVSDMSELGTKRPDELERRGVDADNKLEAYDLPVLNQDD